MPQSVGHAGAVPMQVVKRVEDLKPWALEKVLEKKMKGTVVYGALVADKISTKWKKQRRMVLVTMGLMLVCHTDGNVRRVVDLCELSDIMVQPEGTHTYILFKLGRTEANEPDLLLSSAVDTKNRNSHDPIGFAGLVNLIAGGRNVAVTTVKHLAPNGPIRSLTRLGHNTISAREKIKKCTTAKQTPLSIPTSAPTSTVPSPAHSVESDKMPEYPTDEDVIKASRLRAQSVTLCSTEQQQPDHTIIPPAPQRPRAVSFTMPKPVEGLSAEPTPITHAKAHAMPPVKTLPEDDEGGCGWTEHKDPVTQLTYYHNDKEGKSTWHEPDELKEWKSKTGYPTVTARQQVTLTESVDSDDSTAEASSSDGDSDASSDDEFGVMAASKKSVTSIKQLSSLFDAPAVRVPSHSFEPPAFETHPIEEHGLPLAFRSGSDPVRRQLNRPVMMQQPSRGVAHIQNCIPDFQEVGLDL